MKTVVEILVHYPYFDAARRRIDKRMKVFRWRWVARMYVVMTNYAPRPAFFYPYEEARILTEKETEHAAR